MADIASIGLAVNTKEVKAGIQELDKLAKSGDKVQKSVDKFGNELKQTDKEMGRFIDNSGKMREKNGQFVKGLEKTNSTLKTTKKQTNETASAFRSAASALAAYISVAAGVGTITSFEDAMLGLQATTRATTEEMAALEKQARDLGSTSIFSAEQAANAQKFLAQAGFDTNQILSSTPDVLNLAAAGSLSLAESADIASNVLGGMGLEVSELARVADVMAEAAAASNTNIMQLGDALSTAAPLAATAGVSIEEATAAIGKLSDAGLQGSRAGTGLVGVIRQLSNVTDTGEAALNRYGLSVADVNINTNGLANVLEKLETANLSTADSFAIFGSEAAPAALILADASEQVEMLTTRLNSAEGSAQEMSDILGSGLSASFKELQSVASEVVISLGDSGVGGGIQSLVEAVTFSLRGWDALIDELNEYTGATDEADRATNTLAKSTNFLRVQTLNLADAYNNTSQAQLEATSTRLTLLERSLAAELATLEAQDGVIESIQTGLKRDMLSNVSEELDLVTNALLRYNNANAEGTTRRGRGRSTTISTPTIAAFSGEESEIGVKGYTDEIERLTKAYATTLTPLQQLTEDQKTLNDLLGIASKEDLPAIQDALDNVKDEIQGINNQSGIDWDEIGEDAASSIADELADGDFSSFGDALGSAAASAVGSAVAASLGGVGGAIAGGAATGLISSAIGGRQQTGSSTTVSLSGGQASGFNQQNFSGLLGSSSRTQDLGSSAISALNNSLSVSLSAIDNSLLAMGSTITTSVDEFSTTVKVGEGEFTDAIDEITDDYISANFAAIEDYSRAGETFVETFERINEEMVSVIDSFSLSTGSGSFQSAADAFIENQASTIESSNKKEIESSKKSISDLEKERSKLIEARRKLNSDDSGQRFDINSQIASINRSISEYEDVLNEQLSRVGSGLQTATVDFSNSVLESIATIEGISSDDAVTRLNQLTASYEENYFTLTEQTERAIESAKKELEEFADLGIDETTSLDEFQTAFEAFVNSDAFTPEGYSQWLLAADALADLNNVVDDIDSSGTFESITDFVKDLMGLAVDGTETLAAATAQYQETLALAQTGDADALAALTTDAQAYLDAVERSASTGTDVIIARSQVASDLSGTVPAFATGGSHTGGLRLVGENGPEIEATGPSRIFSNSQSKSMLDNTDLTRQVAELNQTMESGMFAVAKNTNKSYKILQKFDTQGLPQERVV